MLAFWDTSAVVPLLLSESASTDAALAYEESTAMYAWHWLRVEAEAALLRRRAPRKTWELLAKYLEPFHWIDLPAEEVASVAELNRETRLRSADAGHFYCFTRLSEALPKLALVSFDDEMIAAAKKQKLPVWRSTGTLK